MSDHSGETCTSRVMQALPGKRGRIVSFSESDIYVTCIPHFISIFVFLLFKLQLPELELMEKPPEVESCKLSLEKYVDLKSCELSLETSEKLNSCQVSLEKPEQKVMSAAPGETCRSQIM